MTFGTKILAIDYETASTTITNDDLTAILDTSDTWINSRTGIKQRKVLSGNQSSTDLGICAAKKVIKRVEEKTNLTAEDIDLIIAASSAPEDIYPSVSCYIQRSLKADNAACFDLRAACAGFIYSLKTASAFIKSGMYKNILIVATDATTKFTDWNDRSTCVLFGDGAGAAFITASEKDDDIIGIELLSEGKNADYITLKVKRNNCPLVDKLDENIPPYIQMKGKDVYKYVMTKIPLAIEKLANEVNFDIKNADYFIPHQSNQRMIEALAQRLGFSEDKIISNIENYGNMSAASILVALREGIDEGKIKLPATFVLSAFGAGMTAGNAIIKLDNI